MNKLVFYLSQNRSESTKMPENVLGPFPEKEAIVLANLISEKKRRMSNLSV